MADYDGRDGIVWDEETRPARFTADEFETMIELGVFGAIAGRFELVDGEVWRVSAKFSPHADNQEELAAVIRQILSERRPDLKVRQEISFRLTPWTERNPDIAVMPREPRHPRALPASALLLAIEVADSTLGEDLGRRRRDYAAAGVPTYWVVDVKGQRTHVFRDPKSVEGRYESESRTPFGEPLSLLPLLDAEITIPEGGFD